MTDDVSLLPKARETLDRERHLAALRFVVDEGPQVRVGRILLSGNRRTRESVVRGAITVEEKLYCHEMPSSDEIAEWMRGTALVPYLERGNGNGFSVTPTIGMITSKCRK